LIEEEEEEEEQKRSCRILGAKNPRNVAQKKQQNLMMSCRAMLWYKTQGTRILLTVYIYIV